MSAIDFVNVSRPADPYQYAYTAKCFDNYLVQIADRCVDGEIPQPAETCEFGTIAPPRWARLRDTGGGPGPWILQAGFSCPGDPDFPITYDDFAVLPIEPSPLSLQPSTGWVFAGLDTIALTDDTPQGFSVELLGETYQVGAIPDEYSWDFDDGSPPVVTTDPGRPWPDHTISHRYQVSGAATPTLTTRWKGYFRVGGLGDWVEIPGTAETITTGPEITIHTARTRLVEDPLD